MAKNKLTVFQTLERALKGNWNSDQGTTHINSYDMSGANSVLYKTTDKDDYEKTKLELQQNRYLRDRWVKANVDLSVSAFSNLSNVKLMYRDADLMDSFPEIGAALDTVSEESCIFGDTKIKLLNGDVKTVKELFDENVSNFWVYSVDANGECKPSMVERVIYKGVKPLYKITLDDDTVIKCTGDHKWMISDCSWKNTEDLVTGDSLMSIYDKLDVYNHRVKSIEKLNEDGAVYDLLNSSTNHCFGVKCNDGQIISHNCLVSSNSGQIVNVYSKSDRIKAILEDLFVNRLNLQVTAPMIIRQMCKYGNQFMLLDIDNKLGVKDWKQLPVFNVERLENGIQNPYGSNGWSLAVNNGATDDKDLSTKFVWYDENNSQVPFRNWQIAHFRLLTNSMCLPYGCSYLNSARRHWRLLSLMEDMMLIYRLERSIERRVYKIYVGAIDDADVQAYVENIANNFKRTPIIDPMTGQIDLRKNIMDVSQDLFIPVRDANAPTPIDTLPAAQNLTAIDDIKYVQNKVLTALRIPKSFLNFEENAGDGKNLALMDIRFTRVINRIQQAFLMELTKVASIHLYLLGFEDDLTNFNLTMNNPSTQAEQLEIDNIQKKITAFRDAVSDPGNGLPAMSYTRASKEILKWSDKEIKDNLEEIRLERAISAELEKTVQIIRRTGIFDTVDRMYGEPGAEYQEDMQQGGPDDGMGGGMPGGGGGGFGGGLDDLGAPGMEDEGDIAGEEGAEPTADMGGGADMDMGGMPEGGTNESRRGKKPLLTESVLNKELRRSKSHTDELFEKYISRLNVDEERKRKSDVNIVERAKIYDKSLLINEEFNKMIESLNGLDNDKEEAAE